MIKFFRHIRKDLMETNKTGKYLKYAIGEIILVIIGILFALQINNWNIKNNQQEQSKNFMERLMTEVRHNIPLIDAEIEGEKKQISSALSILKMFNSDPGLLKARSLDSLIYICLGNNQMNLKLSVLKEGLNTGQIALISSDSLREQLYGISTVVERVLEYEATDNNDLMDFHKFSYTHVNFRNMDAVFSPYKKQLGVSKFSDNNSLDVLDNIYFENLVDNRYFNSNQQLERYQKLKEDFELLDKLLRQ